MPVINPHTGKEFRWAKGDWTPHTPAIWHKKTIYGGVVHGTVRSIAALDRLDRRAKRVFGVGVEVIQSAFNTTVDASKGTHDLDAVYDLFIPGIGWYRAQRFMRNNGFWCWVRKPPLFGWHIHGFFMVPYPEHTDPSLAFARHGFKVGVYIDGGWSTAGRLTASSQVTDAIHRAFGLYDQHTPGSDGSYWPTDMRGSVFDLGEYINRRKRVQAAA